MVGEGFEWGAVAEGGVQPTAVVEDLDVFGDGESRSSSGGPGLPVVHLVLQGGEERFGGGVVPAHSGAPEAGSHVFVLAELGELTRCVLTGLNESTQHRLVSPTVAVR